MVNGYSLSISSFLFFPATLLYIDESLWFLKLYFVFICFGVVFFSFPSQVVSLSLKVLVWFLFELILDYFGRKNFNFYQNTILVILITVRHSVHLINPIWFGLLQSTLVNFGPIQSTSIQLGSFRLLRSNQSNSVQFSPFGLLWSIRSYLVHSVQSGPYQRFKNRTEPTGSTGSIGNRTLIRSGY